MDVLLFLLSCLSLLLLLIGMFKPSLVVRWGKSRTRKRVVITYGLSFILSFASFISIIPTAPTFSTVDNTQEVSVVAAKPKSTVDQQQSQGQNANTADTPNNSENKDTPQSVENNAQTAPIQSTLFKKQASFQLEGTDPPMFYEGEVNDNQIPDGKGKFTYQVNNQIFTYYEGEVKNGIFNGKGTMYVELSDQIDFSGIFKNGEKVYYPYDNEYYYNTRDYKIEFHGDPAKTKTDSSIKVYYLGGNIFYEGGWKNNQMNGKGTVYYLNGTPKIEGEFKNGELDGAGKKYYDNGQLEQEGTFNEGKLDGKSKLYHKNGNLKADGNYEDGTLLGEAKVYYENGNLHYEGDFDQGWLKEWGMYGDGVEYYENGKIKYQGVFKANKYHGKGTLYNDQGQIIQEGTWDDGIFVE